ncbi:MAG: hypothetical protein ACREQP_02610 [Candidatus Binatia bacterium]
MMSDILLLAQGAYYVATGGWPLLHIGSFLAVTGPKTDLWLVKTVGVLITVIGTALLVAGARHQIGLEISLLAMGTQLALATVDVVYVATRTIGKIYLLDAVVELVLFTGWMVWLSY